MSRTHLVLLHAPSVYDFRENSIMYGPVSDMVPSTPVFEMYPLGFTTMAEYLERYGISTRIVNIAVLMLKRQGLDVDALIRSMRPTAFGIDLHWLPHAHGAIEIARLCKKHHPDIPVIFGGLSASFFHEELITYPCVDYVLRGDSTEEPLRQLMSALLGRGSVADVPNLTWKAPDGSVTTNELSWVPADMNAISLDYSYNMRAVIRHRDMLGFIPFKDWLQYPVCASLICRGCTHNCVTCGGSAHSFRTHFGRDRVAFRDPELLVRDIANIQRYIPGPIFVLNDFLQAGRDYVAEFITGVGALDLKNPIAFEFFRPPHSDFYEFLNEHLNDYSVEISVESHDDEVRGRFGKHSYTMNDLEDSVANALSNGCSRFDLYFMTGIPTQTAASALETVDYLEGAYERLGRDTRFKPFISPMAPFLDPGSRAFDDPAAHGYTLRARTLEEHRQLLVQPSWKHVMNYESHAMPPDEMVDATYEVAQRLLRLKGRLGVEDPQTAEKLRARIDEARATIARIDEIVEGDPRQRDARLTDLAERVRGLSESTVARKSELQWHARANLSHFLNCVGLWFRVNLGMLPRLVNLLFGAWRS